MPDSGWRSNKITPDIDLTDVAFHTAPSGPSAGWNIPNNPTPGELWLVVHIDAGKTGLVPYFFLPDFQAPGPGGTWVAGALIDKIPAAAAVDEEKGQIYRIPCHPGATRVGLFEASAAGVATSVAAIYAAMESIV